MPNHDEATIAHLSMIQGVINRMAGNSFALKALAVTLSAAVLAVTAAQPALVPKLQLAGMVPVVVFWWLDAKNLWLERLYRKLYDDVRHGGDVEAFSMDYRRYKQEVDDVLVIAFSWSVFWLYAAICLVQIVVLVLSM